MITIEKRAYEVFCAKFDRGQFKGQRFGQAFYNEFALHKLTDQNALQNVYEKDGAVAKACIHSFTIFS